MPIRVLIAALPEMLHDIIAGAVKQHPALQVVARLDAADDVAGAARRYDADVVVMSTASMTPALITGELLYARPRLRVLALTPTGRAAHMYRLLPHETVVDDVAPQELVAALLSNGTPSSAP